MLDHARRVFGPGARGCRLILDQPFDAAMRLTDPFRLLKIRQGIIELGTNIRQGCRLWRGMCGSVCGWPRRPQLDGRVDV